MRTLSILGIIVGILIAGYSIWRWGGWLYDEPFRMFMGIFIGISIMGFSYIIDWMTLRDKLDRNKYEKIDSVVREFKTIKDMLRK